MAEGSMAPGPPGGELTRMRQRAVDRLLAHRLEREPADQERYLVECRRRWPRLTRWVEWLLIRDGDGGTISFLDAPLGRLAEQISALAGNSGGADLEPGYRLGPWRIIEPVGEGGMGLVFLGERADGAFEKKVAIKLLKLRGSGLGELMQHECRLLARIEHPAVTRLLDAGVDEGAGPFLVMEWVDGRDLPQWLAEAPSPGTRLEVFESLCDGLEHAHRNRVIHGDIKPNNVRIDRDGRARVMDFGVAQLMDAGSGAGQAFGQTPGFAAPEQVSREPLTPVCDVWSLGKLLAWLMSGSGVLPNRELDAIIARACAHYPDQRYGSVGELAADVRNHRERRPVKALPATSGYRVGRFMARNPVLVGGVAATILALGIGLGLTWVWYQESDRQARQLEQAVVFQEDQLADMDVHAMGMALRDAVQAEVDGSHGASSDNRDPLGEVNFTNVALSGLEDALFEQSRMAIGERFSDQPTVRARLLQTLATAMRGTGLYEQALPVQKDALQTFRDHKGEEDIHTLRSLREQGMLLADLGELEDAEEVLRSAYRASSQVAGDGDPEALRARHHLAEVLRTLGESDAALEKHRHNLNQRRASLGPEHPETLESKARMGAMLREAGDLEEARPLYARVLAGYRDQHGDQHPDTLLAMNNKGLLLARKGKHQEAEALYRAAYDGQRRHHGDDHPWTLQTVGNLGVVLRKLERVDEAVEYYFRSAEGLERQLGQRHPRTLSARHNLGVVLREPDRLGEATEILSAVVEDRSQVLGDDTRSTAISRHELAWTLSEMDRLDEALDVQQRALASLAGEGAEDDWLYGAFLSGKANILAGQRRFPEAESTWLEVLKIYEETLGQDHPRYDTVIEHLDELYLLWQDHFGLAGTGALIETLRARSGSGKRESP